ncbi:hypothetical protein GCM10009193_21920 [Shewanella aestuarii]|nr:hypothetical protein GCM10009193_21920 [Shewanella aestuarii]
MAAMVGAVVSTGGGVTGGVTVGGVTGGSDDSPPPPHAVNNNNRAGVMNEYFCFIWPSFLTCLQHYAAWGDRVQK